MNSQLLLASGGNLAEALYNTVIGMGTVFAVLIFISFLISELKYIPAILDKFTKKEKEADAVEEASVQPEVETVSATDDLELVAVISAAIAAYTGMDQSDFVVRSIRRSAANRWI